MMRTKWSGTLPITQVDFKKVTYDAEENCHPPNSSSRLSYHYDWVYDANPQGGPYLIS